MSLLEEFYELCVMLEKTRAPDGAGGWDTVWADGAEFMAAIVLNTSTQAVVAERQGAKKIFTVTAPKTPALGFHDVFRRKRDGRTFRVTSDGKDLKTPERATFQVSNVTAEEWEPTT